MLLGFWRGVGYFLSIIIIIIGFLLFPIGLIGVVLGFIFIWMLKRSASQERMEKYLKEMRDSTQSDEERKKRKHQEDPNHCVNCGKFMFWDNTKELCGKCRREKKRSDEQQAFLKKEPKKISDIEKEIKKIEEKVKDNVDKGDETVYDMDKRDGTV